VPGFLTRSGHVGASLKRMDVVDWLLDGEPAVELATRVRLLGEDAASPLCVDLRRRLMVEGTVPAILAAQGPDGHWGERDRFYTAKYTGTVWSLLILAEFGADGSDPRIRAAIEAILADSRHPASGAFGMSRSRRDGGGTGASVIPCLTGNMAFALLRLGQADDPRVRATIDWITTYLRFDDGDGPAPTGWPYDTYEMCWGRHTCSMGIVKALKALAELPEPRRTPAVRDTIASAAEWLLVHHVHKRSHDLAKVSKPGWTKFGFPRMYQTDALEILLLLTRLGYADERMDEALDLVAAKRDDSGRWLLEDTFNDRFVTAVETRREPSRWVTLHALEVLAARSARAC